MSNNPHSTLHATDLRQATPATIIPVIPFRSSNTRSSSTSLLVSSSVDNSQTYGCHTHVRSSVFDTHCQVHACITHLCTKLKSDQLDFCRGCHLDARSSSSSLLIAAASTVTASVSCTVDSISVDMNDARMRTQTAFRELTVRLEVECVNLTEPTDKRARNVIRQCLSELEYVRTIYATAQEGTPLIKL
jgi:hypothetical protein